MAHKCDGCKYKGEHQEMMFRPMGVCTREVNLVEAVQNYEAEKCPYKKTNADRIRAMSDEELAELFGAILRDREIILLQQLRKQGVEASIVEMPELTLAANLEWLKQPAEDTPYDEEDGLEEKEEI